MVDQNQGIIALIINTIITIICIDIKYFVL